MDIIKRRNKKMNAEINKDVGQRVQELRIKHDLTLEELSEFLGVTPGFLGLIERGKRGLTIRLLIMLSALFRVSQEYLTLGVRPPIKFTDNPLVFLKNAIKNFCF